MLGNLLKPEFEELIRSRDWNSLREAFTEMDPADVAEVIEDLPAQESGVLFRLLPRDIAALVFEYLPPGQQSEVVGTLATEELKNLLNEMAPDDRTRLLEELPAEVTRRALTSLSPTELKVARQLLGYPEKSAGRYMTPEYLTLPGNLSASAALDYVRSHGQGRETLHVLYIVDEKGRLLDEVRLASLVLSKPDTRVIDIHDRQLVSIPATADREEVIGFFEKYDRVVLPVTDSRGVMLGIITVDDVLDVAEEEATEDIQRMGGMEALEAPYLESGLLEMLRKRVGWLTLLFLGQMFTATAMAHYQDAIAQAVFLGTFVPLIISSGGNSGSQATSLIIRALAVRDVSLRDWWRVAMRESISGVALGVFLGVLGALRIALWPGHETLYGEHFLWVGVAVGFSVLGVVTFGTLCGSMLPFLLRRLGLDPATASAPFVATLVDVTGVVIYFTVASTLLAGRVF
ncbi:magnesium transporter [Stigmatella aurantiaca]|uniref:Magnesium transporter MgtE n=1 Tax=Stigmatella aurantiaca TaxID=41 RepID=A0A1H7UL58_STIAU|nr:MULTISPECIES: magnesium transporter [Stigmatella]SEL97753.1 magnesium transporter [Stigmatella aurantiaca]